VNKRLKQLRLDFVSIMKHEEEKQIASYKMKKSVTITILSLAAILIVFHFLLFY